MKNYILYNLLAGGRKNEKRINSLEIEKGDAVFLAVTDITDYENFFKNLEPQDRVILCGGDGTLNRFVNMIDGIDCQNDIFYLAAGSGNDFLNDLNLKPTNVPIKINEYIKNLPTMEVGGKKYKFVNGIGYGIDGFCCEERAKIKEKTGKSANYALVTLKGLFRGFKPRKATVIVDGVEHNYERVWMVSSMFGRFFGGGIQIAPIQDRNNENGEVTVLIAHDLSKLKIIWLFTTIFKAKHLKYKKYVTAIKGKNIRVKYEYPAPLQIDGEVLSNVDEYIVTTEKNKQYI